MTQCPTCGHFVQSIFDHVHIECEHDMTEDEINALLQAAEAEETDTVSDTVTLITLDTHAVEDEIQDHISAGSSDLDLTDITREHINKALAVIQPDDAFYYAFDNLRSRVIEYAAELANAKETDT